RGRDSPTTPPLCTTVASASNGRLHESRRAATWGRAPIACPRATVAIRSQLLVAIHGRAWRRSATGRVDYFGTAQDERVSILRDFPGSPCPKGECPFGFLSKTSPPAGRKLPVAPEQMNATATSLLQPLFIF